VRPAVVTPSRPVEPTVSDAQTEDQIEVWPVSHFLEALARNRLWP
jgi:hypothetical protein